MLIRTDFFYSGQTHKLALDLLEYGLMEQTGFVVITGEIGSGKTLLIRHLMKGAPADLVIGLVSNTHPGFGELLRWVTSAFEVYHREKDKVELYEDFVAFLIEQKKAERRVALVIDEAQNLDIEALEELRMLSNVNCDEDFLLQIILVGQPNLLDKLKVPNLIQLVQRVGIHFHIDALNFTECTHYIRHRLQVAGGQTEIFDDYACAAVYYFSKGIPRLINLLCDLSMVVSYANNSPTVRLDHVIGVAMQRNRAGLTTSVADDVSPDDARRAILDLCAVRPAAETTA